MSSFLIIVYFEALAQKMAKIKYFDHIRFNAYYKKIMMVCVGDLKSMTDDILKVR